MTIYCEIRVQGHLDEHWAVWFGRLQLAQLPGGETLLCGELPDQAALYGTLQRLGDLNLELVSLISCDLAAKRRRDP